MAIAPPPGRHRGGLVVVIVLGIVFFTLLTMLIVYGGKHRNGPDKPASETLTVLPIRIRIRTEPSAKAPVVATATTGEQLVLLEDRGEWARVQNAEGLSGWAERNYLERTSERERRMERFAAIRKLPPLSGIVTERTPLYAGPGIFYPLVGELPAHSEVKVFTRDHDFYAIDREGQVAYADIDTIDVSASGSPQLDVSTTTPATETTASAAPPPTETTATQPPAETDSRPPAPVEPSARTGVYAVVPAGGTQPEEIDRVIPRYPAMARRAGVAGAVVIRGIVRKDGRIDNVEILKDLPQGLGQAAADAVEQWRFRPATYRGEPIDVYYTVTVNFRLQ